MSSHEATKSPPPVTYTPSPPIVGSVLTCTRCYRVYPYPQPGEEIRCECGWRYTNVDGQIEEDFYPRL